MARTADPVQMSPLRARRATLSASIGACARRVPPYGRRRWSRMRGYNLRHSRHAASCKEVHTRASLICFCMRHASQVTARAISFEISYAYMMARQMPRQSICCRRNVNYAIPRHARAAARRAAARACAPATTYG